MSHVQTKVETGEFQPGSRLPPVRELASFFGVSLVTANRALKELKNKGIIRSRPRKGTFIAGEDMSQPPPSLPHLKPVKSKAEKVAAEMARKIARGDIRIGESLPLRKVLRHQLGTSPATLNRALEIAERNHLIRRSGSGFVVGSHKAQSSAAIQKVSALPAWSVSRGSIVREPTRRAEFILEMEEELSRHNIRYLGGQGPRAVKRKAPSMRIESDTMGCFYESGPAVVQAVAGTNRRLMERELSRINRLGIPIVSFNCAAIHNVFPELSFRPYGNIFPFGLDNHKSGVLAGEYLGLQNHRNVAYFSFGPGAWISQRSKGLERGLKGISAGKSELIHLQAKLPDKGRRFSYDSHSPQLVDDVAKFTKRVFDGFRFSQESLARQMAGEAFKIVMRDHHHVGLQPAFEKALADPRITAWVGSDSVVGLAAARFLASKSITVPRQISLIAIDDNEFLSHFGITGCSLQVGRMGYLAAHCILGDVPIKRDRLGVVECPAGIVDRGSVGRVAQ